MYAIFQASGGTITLPHSSELQATLGQEVAGGNGSQVLASGLLQPGDVIAFELNGGGDYDHVGIYIGDGDMIDAPATGQYVRVDNLATTYCSLCRLRRCGGVGAALVALVGAVAACSGSSHTASKPAVTTHPPVATSRPHVGTTARATSSFGPKQPAPSPTP
jgi:hypothetical protein